MQEVTTITFEKRAEFYMRGIADAQKMKFDSSFCNRSEDAWMSYVAGWATFSAGWANEYKNHLPKEIKLI